MKKTPSFEKAHILVIGDIILDRYLMGPIHRISPEAPVPVIKINQKDERLGGAANVALNIKTLGAQVTLLGITGKDKEADILSNLLEKAGIQSALIKNKNQPTIHKTRIISEQQQMLRLDVEEKYEFNSDELFSAYERELEKADVVILSDYAKGTINDPQRLIQTAKEKNVPILVDPKSNNFTCYQHATLVTPNTKEFEAVVGPCSNEEEIIEKGMNLLKQHHFSSLLITRGINGMLLLSKDNPPFHLKALAQEVFDVTGAGDTVIATLATALAAKMDIQSATTLSNTAAAISVRKHGTSTVSLHELRREMQQHDTCNPNIISEENLENIIADAKAHGEKIVMTNGCFDLLHTGHITYLEAAKALGDRLIIAVNDDASVARLKSADRPINSLENRMTVLSGLRATDWVISFSEDTPLRLIELIKPDVLVKGGDYNESTIVGADFVKNCGGSVEVIPFVPGHSTTSTVEKIKVTE